METLSSLFYDRKSVFRMEVLEIVRLKTMRTEVLVGWCWYQILEKEFEHIAILNFEYYSLKVLLR